MMNDEEHLIEQYIEQDPSRPGRYNVRLKDYGVHVWALIGHLKAVGWDIAQTASDYDVPQEAVEAAHAYYQQNKAVIDAYIEANAAPSTARLKSFCGCRTGWQPVLQIVTIEVFRPTGTSEGEVPVSFDQA